ncbi:MAG: S-ribosylhomocysteine lyase [Clostridia bacterium]|nr:S-ribosylhomocysteine lyase [Clostridia bacterium]
MKKIQSFTVDHRTLVPGMYVSRVDGDVITYDLRFIKPNTPPYLEPAAMHTVEHLMATFVRNSKMGDEIVYFGPMGCRTGYYLLTRVTITREEALVLVKEALRFTADFEGEIPGTKEPECGNYREHDLSAAKRDAAAMLQVLECWTVADMDYFDYLED